MSCYFIAQITIHDRQEYQKYLDGTDAVFAKYKGEILAVDEHPVLLEGEWRHQRLVLIRFPDQAELRRWYDSPEYQAIAAHRRRAAAGDVIAVTGRG